MGGGELHLQFGGWWACREISLHLVDGGFVEKYHLVESLECWCVLEGLGFKSPLGE